MKGVQKDTRERLEWHIEVDNERDVDSKLASILQFNMEIVRNIRHTREDFIEVLTHIKQRQAEGIAAAKSNGV